MKLLKFVLKEVKVYLAWAIVAWAVFISNLVRNIVGANPAELNEQVWAGAVVIIILIVFVVDAVLRFKKLNGTR